MMHHEVLHRVYSDDSGASAMAAHLALRRPYLTTLGEQVFNLNGTSCTLSATWVKGGKVMGGWELGVSAQRLSVCMPAGVVARADGCRRR